MTDSKNPEPEWFGGRSSAVSLTFDDGMDSHLEAVVPALDAREMAGTFYVKTDDADRLRRFREPQRRGHEIGNHTVHHWCSRAHRLEADARGLEDLTLDDMADRARRVGPSPAWGLPRRRVLQLLLPVLRHVRRSRRDPTQLCAARCRTLHSRPWRK